MHIRKHFLLLLVGRAYLDPPALMVDVVIAGVVGCDVLQRIERQGIAAMVVHGFDSGAREEPHALTGTHTGQFEG